MDTPRVTVMIPALDEDAWIDACLQSLASQDFAEAWEIVIADGGSTDGTLDRVEAWRRRLPITVVHNPARVQSEGLNLAAGAARGEILVRADAHSLYGSDYVRRCVEVLSETSATMVGGPMRPKGSTPFGQAVAAALQSPMAIGPGKFHHSSTQEDVDTVYLGAFRRSDFQRLGGYRTLPSRVAEDADLAFRIRRANGRVVLDPTIRSTYRPRETPGALWWQFRRYGAGKADMLYVNGTWPSWRPLAPLLLVLGLVAGLVLGPAVGWWPLLGLVALWLGALVLSARLRPQVVVAGAIMHLAYGLGLWQGLFRSPRKVRSEVE